MRFMKREDLYMGLLLIAIFTLFMPISFLESFHTSFLFNSSLWWLSSFLKFAVLATLGEMIGLRIKTGNYNQKGFGVIPRAVVWGFLGICIKMAFVIFAYGTPVLLEKLFGVVDAGGAMKAKNIFEAFDLGLGGTRILDAFAISSFMNLIFAPVFMTFHKITDTHIIDNGGTLRGLFKPIDFGNILSKLNWFVQWDFVFKRTIPFFWIPAHTITFMMPPEYRVVFAAILGAVLGIFLSIASQKGK